MPRPKRKASALIIHPLVPVAKAAKVLRIAPELLIEKLNEGEILGENRPLDLRKHDKKGHKKGEQESQNNSWFIYASEFNRLLDERLAQYEKLSLLSMVKPILSWPAPAQGFALNR